MTFIIFVTNRTDIFILIFIIVVWHLLVEP